jgi:hypothetical protein
MASVVQARTWNWTRRVDTEETCLDRMWYKVLPDGKEEDSDIFSETAQQSHEIGVPFL